MRAIHRRLVWGGLGLVVGVLAACQDPYGPLEPLLTEEAVTLTTPTSPRTSLPWALDVSVPPGTFGIGGGRFPERANDAGQWDFALRRSGDAFELAPAALYGLPNGAALSDPIEGRAFDDLREVPRNQPFRSDVARPVRPGLIYFARSRTFASGFYGCQQFAKVQVVAVDATADTVRLKVVANANCGDRRLAR